MARCKVGARFTAIRVHCLHVRTRPVPRGQKLKWVSFVLAAAVLGSVLILVGGLTVFATSPTCRCFRLTARVRHALDKPCWGW